jgi:hypothetical protein
MKPLVQIPVPPKKRKEKKKFVYSIYSLYFSKAAKNKLQKKKPALGHDVTCL